MSLRSGRTVRSARKNDGNGGDFSLYTYGPVALWIPGGAGWRVAQATRLRLCGAATADVISSPVGGYAMSPASNPRLSRVLTPFLMLVAVAVSVTANASTVVVDHCGQVVAGTAMLATDLDCTSTGVDALVVETGKLFLQGFSLTGARIHCTSFCKIIGPGSLSLDPALLTVPPASQDNYGLLVERSLTLTGVSLVGGAVTHNGAARVSDSNVDAGTSVGVGSAKSLKILSSSISGRVYGARRVTLFDVSVVDGTVSSNRIKVTDSSIDNGGGVRASKSAIVENSTITDSFGNGVEAYSYVQPYYLNRGVGKVKVSNSTISGSAGFGVYSWVSASISDSQLLDNAQGGVFTATYREKNGFIHYNLGTVRLTNSTISGGPVGIYGIKVITENSSITGSEQVGIWAQGLDATDTVVAASSSDPACGVSMECADLATYNKPIGSNLTCNTSRKLTGLDPLFLIPSYIGTETWGVCALD